MRETDAIIVAAGGGSRRVNLALYLDGEAAEAAEREANAWIKSLRLARIDGETFRDRFTYRDDSLWWFAELYLHKRRVVVSALELIAALETLLERERPAGVDLPGADPLTRLAAGQVLRARGIATQLPLPAGDWRAHASIAARSWFHAARAAADRLRPGNRRPATRPVAVAAFIHTAFWRLETDEEAYIGPVLHELAGRLPAGGVQLVGLGPRTNFRARRWGQRLAEFGDPAARSLPLAPIELYSSARGIAGALAFWRRRSVVRRALMSSDDLREAAVVRGCDLWPILRGELVGIADLQFPWSVLAMDEAACALDALAPGVVVTYAEAGGWGRALVLEARRRHIPAIGLQHGFIYRHWLNYLHEPDEMQPSAANAADRGFPLPDRTLVYDRFAARHLVHAGRFPEDAVLVTGGPRLDAFVETARRLTAEDRERVRARIGAQAGQHVVVVATKYSQMRPAFHALVEAVARMPDVQLVVKCHPAETPGPYQRAAGSVPNIVVAPADADLAALVAIARLVVTVNSTAAIEAMPLEVPALIVALPNNLSPFVEAGAVEGARTLEEIGPALTALLYDEERRSRLARGRQAFMEQYAIGSDGRAASRAAEAILSAGREARRPSQGRSGSCVR